MKFTHYLLITIVMSALTIAPSDLYAQTPQSPQTSLKCNEFTFDATKSHLPEGSDVSILWDLGDGTTSTDLLVTHTYHHSGDYTVHLSITDNSGFECSMGRATRVIRAHIPPHASFISENKACVHEPLTFDATTSYAEIEEDLSYTWNFSDGKIQKGEAIIQKTYDRGGDYKVLLTVDDQSSTMCNTHTAEKTVHINAPPVADAGDDIIYRCDSSPEDRMIHFDASATTDINHDPLSYIWDFGDGFKVNGVKVSHQYARSGNYDVRLIVSDNTLPDCEADVDFVSVKIGVPPQAKAGEDHVACSDEEVQFDGSASHVAKKGTAAAQWFFGDGDSRDGLYATHRYNSPGTYQATLSLENKLNSMCPESRDTRTITINSPPTASINTESSACVGNKVFFDASSAVDPDGDPLKYYWNFGDGATSKSGPKTSHVYMQGGHYRVSLVVDDQRVTSCSTATARANIHINTPPIADAGPNLSCCTDKAASFTASASSDPDGDRLTYTWDFGDGTTTEGEVLTHTYTHQGSYNVLLTVDDHSGSACSQSTDGFVAVVKESPVPMIDIR